MQVRQYNFYLIYFENSVQVLREALPKWGDSLALVFQRESGEQFMRPQLSGPLQFTGDDYDTIMGRAFDEQLGVRIQNRENVNEIYDFTFYRTDCEINEDDKIISVTPQYSDFYNTILDGLDKEFDLIKLAPAIQRVQFDKRPMFQVYVSGAQSVGCFLTGMWWEEPVTTPTADNNTLVNTYKFTKAAERRQIFIKPSSEATAIRANDVFLDDAISSIPFDHANDQIRLVCTLVDIGGSYRANYELYFGDTLGYHAQSQVPASNNYSVVLQPTFGYSGTMEVEVSTFAVYTRMITDAVTVGSTTTEAIPSPDLVADNRNYTRVLRVAPTAAILFGTELTSTPTEYGIGMEYYNVPYYYALPYSPVLGKPVFPVSRNDWGRVSVWFVEVVGYTEIEQQARVPAVLRDAFPLWSVISVLLNAIGANVTHEGTAAYSQFLYGANPISGTNYRLLISPKSNILTLNYDQPAQTAPITLREVLNMLRDCYRCFWYVDDDYRLRIEHISFFRNGGSYDDTEPDVWKDLTTLQSIRNGKPLAYHTSKYKYDKSQMPARYEFAWMDSVTAIFAGYPINMKSNYVQKDLIEKISVNKFTSDLDYMLLNPSDVSRDGFALLSSVDGVVPYVTMDGVTMQNGRLSFAILEGFYLYDLPGRKYEINGIEGTALGIKRGKVQEVSFPSMGAPDLLGLVKTFIGEGAIRKIELNLSSRMAEGEIEYDTE